MDNLNEKIKTIVGSEKTVQKCHDFNNKFRVEEWYFAKTNWINCDFQCFIVGDVIFGILEVCERNLDLPFFPWAVSYTWGARRFVNHERYFFSFRKWAQIKSFHGRIEIVSRKDLVGRILFRRTDWQPTHIINQ